MVNFVFKVSKIILSMIIDDLFVLLSGLLYSCQNIIKSSLCIIFDKTATLNAFPQFYFMLHIIHSYIYIYI